MADSEIVSVIQANLSAVRQQIDAACVRSGRNPDDVRLVAVSKYAHWTWVTALAEFHSLFGENRPQQLAERQALLPQVEWHLIGQLQRNKVRLAIQHAHTIHSIDSVRLLERIVVVAADLNIRPRLLLEVNVSGESTKAGFHPDELRSAWNQICRFSGQAEIVGLMTMAPEADDPEEARIHFAALNRLRNELSDLAVNSVTLSELSMGMSGDFVPAVEEGATLVRIGSRLFEGLPRVE
ncbi:MAG: YggS family pyridoxal phosphate-dependent enzyme [Planctomycetaceae bacterium]|nr:YggS family pyridoxal phosphate-dependent enzyme [Planctomycetaceae bacterium]